VCWIRRFTGLVDRVFAWLTNAENQRFIVRSKTGPGWLVTWDFEQAGARTRLLWTGQLTTKGFARLFEPLIGGQMRAQIARQFEDRPRLIESEIPEGQDA